MNTTKNRTMNLDGTSKQQELTVNSDSGGDGEQANTVEGYGNEVGQESQFQGSPWDESQDDQSMSPTLTRMSNLGKRKKKKKKAKRKIPKYPESGYRLPCTQEFEDAYNALYYPDY